MAVSQLRGNSQLSIRRQAVLPFLSVPQNKARLFKKFRPPGGAVASSLEVRRRKRLGARVLAPATFSRRPFSPLVATPPSSPDPTPPPPVVVDESDGDGSSEDFGQLHVPAAAAAAVAKAKPDFEPLIVWEPPAEPEAPACGAEAGTDGSQGDGSEKENAGAENAGAESKVAQLPPVSVDPTLCRFLRSHQREGVQFMFDCVTGQRDFGKGCILADDMVRRVLLIVARGVRVRGVVAALDALLSPDARRAPSCTGSGQDAAGHHVDVDAAAARA